MVSNLQNNRLTSKLNILWTKVQRFGSGLKVLLQDEFIITFIFVTIMMLQILLYHILRDIATAPGSVADGPEMPTPITFPQFWILFLNPARCSPLDHLHKMADTLARWIFYMQMYVVLTHNSRQYFCIFSITHLTDQITTSLLDISLENSVPVLRGPYQMDRQTRYGVASVTIDLALICHRAKLELPDATERNALKCIV